MWTRVCVMSDREEAVRWWDELVELLRAKWRRWPKHPVFEADVRCVFLYRLTNRWSRGYKEKFQGEAT